MKKPLPEAPAYETRAWTSKWIHGNTMDPTKPAPFLRCTFKLRAAPEKASAFICSAGWHELYVNGRKVGDRVLAPAATQFQRHLSYVEYDLSGLLREGRNAVVLLLGNGWFNCFTEEVWTFSKAPWRNAPKALCDIVADGRVVAAGDASWRRHDSPILFNALRNGEFYDARRELPGFSDPGLRDASWPRASIGYAPGGLVVREISAPCRETESYAPIGSIRLEGGATVYDFGRNIAGWCALRVKGEAGAKVSIDYGERVDEHGDLFQKRIDTFVKSGLFQHDEYTLRGAPEGEAWHPRFTYHGFQYAKITVEGRAEVESVEARFVHSDFADAGSLETSDPMFARLQELTRRSYLSNFVGIATDCPHREKNGWTGDAQLACETGLWNFAAADGYRGFLQLFADTQLPNGAVSCIAPCSAWGYEWGSGPAWDSLLFELPWQLYRFLGDDSSIRRFYPAMLRYLDYADTWLDARGLYDFGLGDWCPADESHAPEPALTSTGYIYLDLRRTAFFARLLGRKGEAARLERRAARVRKAFRKAYVRPDGTVGNDSWTALGAAVYFGFAEDDEAPRFAARLAEKVRANAHKADFGILGAKYVPRVLADFGYADDAFRLFVQPDFPGYGNWIARGATSLWESWSGEDSRNHIMFGDLSAWAYEYACGLKPDVEHPGFARLRVKPCFLAGVQNFEARHRAPQGEIVSGWRRKDGRTVYSLSLPDGVLADVELPGVSETGVTGHREWTV